MNKTAFESDAETSAEKAGFSFKNAAKIPLRVQYLLEKERIKQEIGDLEDIRQALGLSQRRLCRLLLVDPSAWTRWLRTPEGAPPHVYQALRWLMELRKSNPDVTGPRDLSTQVDRLQATTQSKIKALEEHIAQLERALSLTATVQPATPLDASAIESLLRLRENSVEKELDELRSKIALLVEKSASKTRIAKAKRSKMSAKNVRKVSKRAPKRVTKKQKTKAKKATQRKVAPKKSKLAKRSKTTKRLKRAKRGSSRWR